MRAMESIPMNRIGRWVGGLERRVSAAVRKDMRSWEEQAAARRMCSRRSEEEENEEEETVRRR